MNVTVNDAVNQWMATQSKPVKDAYNTKCTEASNDDLSTWRNVGGGLFDYRVSGDDRLVAKKSGGRDPAPADTFNILAMYRHAKKGKTFVRGEKVPAYG
jgi:hypothetical protein